MSDNYILPESNLGVQHLKTWPKYFEAVQRGSKTFEIRQNDRPFLVHQKLVLHEFDPETREFSGRTLERRVSYMTDWEQKPGFVVLGLSCESEKDARIAEHGDQAENAV